MARLRKPTWHSTYLLGVALLLPIGTIVLVSYYFTRMDGFSRSTGPQGWAFSIIALAGGLSALMATMLALFASATYRARVRFENEYRSLQRYINEDVARERTRLLRNLDLVSATQQVSLAIKQEVDFERIISVVLEQIEHFASSDICTVFVVDQDGLAVPRAQRQRGCDRFPPELDAESVDSSLVADAVANGRSMRKLDESTGEYVLAVYFSTPEGVRGAVRISRNISGDADFKDDLDNYESAVGQLVRMVSLGLKAASMWDRAIKDEKTGLFNANHYADQIARQVTSAKRTGSPLSLIMLDIDKFKHINDTYGHLAGDVVLAQVSELLQREAREGDTTFRYGGEELCVVCTGTTEDDAAQAAERLRSAIAQTEFRDDRGRLLPISASFGVAEFDRLAMASEQELKEACDRALYVAKDKGRNLVVVALGGDEFRVLDRSGIVKTEVKRRMGLAGDNSPLEEKRRANKRATNKISKRVDLGESIDALANGLADIVDGDSDRARIVDSVVREATEYLTRNLSARLTDSADANPPGEKPAKRIGTKAAAGATKRKRPRKKAAKLTAEERRLKEASDRLDGLTPEEGEQLVAGKAPSKRSRKTPSRKSKRRTRISK